MAGSEPGRATLRKVCLSQAVGLYSSSNSCCYQILQYSTGCQGITKGLGDKLEPEALLEPKVEEF